MSKFQDKAKEIAELLEEKDKNYGDWNVTEKIFELLYSHVLYPYQYPQALAVIRVIDKLRRISHGALKDSWEDIMGYALLMLADAEPDINPICPECEFGFAQDEDWVLNNDGKKIHRTCRKADPTKPCYVCGSVIASLADRQVNTKGVAVHKHCWCPKCNSGIYHPGSNIVTKLNHWEHQVCPNIEMPKAQVPNTTDKKNSEK